MAKSTSKINKKGSQGAKLMFENDLQILDKQIEQCKKLIKTTTSETEKYEQEYKLYMLQEMRLDVLIQKQFFEGK